MKGDWGAAAREGFKMGGGRLGRGDYPNSSVHFCFSIHNVVLQRRAKESIIWPPAVGGGGGVGWGGVKCACASIQLELPGPDMNVLFECVHDGLFGPSCPDSSSRSEQSRQEPKESRTPPKTRNLQSGWRGRLVIGAVRPTLTTWHGRRVCLWRSGMVRR